MRRRTLPLLLVCALGFASRAAEPIRPAVDENAIIAEMEALIDVSSDLDEKALETVHNLTRKGIEAHDAREFDRAVQLYRQALEVNPLADNVYYELAYTYTTAGDQVKALDALIRALTLNPKAEIYHVLRASVLDDLGFREEAVAAYQELLEIQPGSYLGHLNLGITLARLGQRERAEAAFLRAIEIAPSHPSGYFHMALLCETLGYSYDERKYLEKFLDVGGEDRRLPRVKERLAALRKHEVVVDPEHPYPELQIVEKMTRASWAADLHEKKFPAARGYALTFEEDKDVYTTILPMWRERKREDPQASYGPYDLLMRIDDAGFLDEYIWYHRQRVFGERATAWMASHAKRVDTFLEWARTEGLLADEAQRPPEASPIDRLRGLPTELLETVEGSEVAYVVGAELDPARGWLEDERKRFASELELEGSDRVACGKAAQALDQKIPAYGARALVPVYRCFVPGEAGYEHGARRARSLGLESREIDFRPSAALAFGEDVRVNVDPSWLFYGLAKAAWRKEPQLRERYGESASGTRASITEEMFALAVTAGAYANTVDPIATEEPDVAPEGDGEAEAQVVDEPPERIPALDRLVEAVRADRLRGYVLYEVIHKAYGLPLDRLQEEDATQVAAYLFGHVIVRTQAGPASSE